MSDMLDVVSYNKGRIDGWNEGYLYALEEVAKHLLKRSYQLKEELKATDKDERGDP